MDCYCHHGWQCETHPHTPYPHDNCVGPGEQCSDPHCPYWQGEQPAALDHSLFDVLFASTRDSDDDH